jgi:hypothetical protein
MTTASGLSVDTSSVIPSVEIRIAPRVQRTSFDTPRTMAPQIATEIGLHRIAVRTRFALSPGFVSGTWTTVRILRGLDSARHRRLLRMGHLYSERRPQRVAKTRTGGPPATICHPEAEESLAKPRTPNEGPMHFL